MKVKQLMHVCSLSSLQTKEKACVSLKCCMYSLRKRGSFCCVCFGVLKNYLSAVCFRWFSGSFGTFLAIWRFLWQISKKPVSVTKKDISDHIPQSIYTGLWFYGSGFGCKSLSKMATLDQIWEIYHTMHSCWNYLSLKMVWFLTTLSESQKRRYITSSHR